MKVLMVFVADHTVDMDDARRALQEASTGEATVVGPDFAALVANTGEWQAQQSRRHLRNLPRTLTSFVFAGALTGAAWASFAMGELLDLLARQVRTRSRGEHARAESAQMPRSTLFAVVDSESTEEIGRKLAQFDGRVLQIPLPDWQERAGKPAPETPAASEQPAGSAELE